ncbi:MAG: efflux RND transporter periplasmic adaptor subunit, partial [Deltaproteobacteria bacterium]|nr:efflux RND transporter periplasmic adaptor subunit [Deltaproteobacteria bacterium]
SGKLIELHVDARDTIHKGQLLARLDDTEQHTRVAKAQAAFAEARSATQKAAADVERAVAVLEERRVAHRRKQELLRTDVIPRAMADEAERDLRVAAAELQQARGQVEFAKAAVQSAAANLNAEEVKLRQHRLHAPYDGLVSERKKELGSVLAAGESLLTIVDPTTRWGKMYVDEAHAGGITVGKPARVRLRSLPGTVREAEVVRVDVESDRVNEERVVYVKCLSCPATFYLGEQAEVWVRVETLARAILVPEKNVEKYDGARGVVWTVRDERLEKQEVTFHAKTLEGLLPIASGLPEDARVVVSALVGLRAGDRVRAVEAEGSP